MPEQLWTVDEVAAFLHISRNTAYIATREGRIPSIKIGTLVRFDPDEIRRWLDANRRGNGAKT